MSVTSGNLKAGLDMFLPSYCRHILSIDRMVNCIKNTRVGRIRLDQSLTVEMGNELTECLDGIDSRASDESSFQRICSRDEHGGNMLLTCQSHHGQDAIGMTKATINAESSKGQ